MLVVSCAYSNKTSYLHVVRISSTPFLERSVFPGQCLEFQALPEACLEVYSYQFLGPIREDTILCDRLRVDKVLYFGRQSN